MKLRRFGRMLGALAAAAALLAGAPLASATPASPPPTAQGAGQGHVAQNATTGVIEGAFISFVAPAAGALLENYTTDGVRFFSRVSVPGYALADTRFSGSLVRLLGSPASADVHDTPGPTLIATFLANASATFELGTGITAAAGPNGGLVLSVSGSNRTGTAWGDCALAIDLASTAFSVAAPADCKVNFNSQAHTGANGSNVAAAAQTGALAAEVYVGDTPGDPSDIAAYGNATVIVAHAGDRTIVSVETLSDGPRSVVIHFAAPAAGDHTQVLIDGKPAKAADGMDDALQPADDGGQIEYLLTADGSTGLLVVSLPNSGSHVIEMQSVGAGPAPPAASPSPLLAAVLAMALVAGAAVVVFRRR
jgi:hypothetical protein